jgi:hypothetical protein
MTYIRLIFCALLANISLYGMQEEIARENANLKFDLLLQKFGYKPGEWMKNDEPFWYPVVRDTSIPLDRAFFEIYRERGGDLNASAYAVQKNKPSAHILDIVIADRCQSGLIRMILELGVDAKAKNNKEFGCLHALGHYSRYEEYLKGGGQENLVELFTHYGADINAISFYGWTPLDCALQTSAANLAKLLLKQGAECTQAICIVNLKYALIGKKSEETQFFIAGFWRNFQRNRFLMAALWGLKHMPHTNKEIRKKIISFLPDYLPDHCLSKVYSKRWVKGILKKRRRVKVRLIDELKPYIGAAPTGDIWNLMNGLKGDAKALVSNANAYANPASDLDKTKKCSIQ